MALRVSDLSDEELVSIVTIMDRKIDSLPPGELYHMGNQPGGPYTNERILSAISEVKGEVTIDDPQTFCDEICDKIGELILGMFEKGQL